MERKYYCNKTDQPCLSSTPYHCWSIDCMFQKHDTLDTMKREIKEACQRALLDPRTRGGKRGEKQYGHPLFYEILDELRDLHSLKNHDYAGDDPLSNLKLCERGGIEGWKGVVVRLTDKISRLLTFMGKGELMVRDESIEDTLKDTAIYAILGLILYREGNETRTNSREV